MRLKLETEDTPFAVLMICKPGRSVFARRMAGAGNEPVHFPRFQHHGAEIGGIFQELFRLVGRHALGGAELAQLRVILGKLGRGERVDDRDPRKVDLGVCGFDFLLVSEQDDLRDPLFRRVGGSLYDPFVLAFAENDFFVQCLCFVLDLGQVRFS